ncbi:MAG TPA: hypothetical protein ENK37_04310, partial [Oceanithermus profundus]|nr:hypothetical protein [Oceanithermus profundus]
MKPGQPTPANPGPRPSCLSTLLAYLRSFYRRHRRLLWTTLLVFLLYLFFLPLYAYVLRFFAPELMQIPSSPPGHLRFALLLVLPLFPFALLHLLAVGLYVLLHVPRPPFRPNLRPYLYAALLALVLYYLPGLPYPSAYDSQDQSTPVPTVTKPVTLTGARLTTPDLMATLDVAPGAVRN